MDGVVVAGRCCVVLTAAAPRSPQHMAPHDAARPKCIHASRALKQWRRICDAVIVVAVRKCHAVARGTARTRPHSDDNMGKVGARHCPLRRVLSRSFGLEAGARYGMARGNGSMAGAKHLHRHPHRIANAIAVAVAPSAPLPYPLPPSRPATCRPVETACLAWLLGQRRHRQRHPRMLLLLLSCCPALLSCHGSPPVAIPRRSSQRGTLTLLTAVPQRRAFALHSPEDFPKYAS